MADNEQLQPLTGQVWYPVIEQGKYARGILTYTTDGMLSLADEITTNVVWSASINAPNKFRFDLTRIKGEQVDGVDYKSDRNKPNPYQIFFYNPRDFNPLTFPQIRAMFKAKPWKKIFEPPAN